MTLHAYTSFTYSYLNRARVLAKSCKRHHPDWFFWAVITDKQPDGFRLDLSQEPFDGVILVEELYGRETDSWLFKHDIVEACTAVKGRALKHLLSLSDCENVVYLDPDIAVFNPLSSVQEALLTHSIVLTPHQLGPDDTTQAIFDNEVASLDYGSFNLGFLAVRNDAEAGRFTEWWTNRLDTLCYDRLDQGIFVDQKWCNLVPCFFDSVKVLRDPGCNVASWNLSNRHVSFDEAGMIRCNGEPLKFYHFTKLGPIGDTMTQRYAGSNVEVYELWQWYRSEVARLTDPAIPGGWWYYGTFSDGLKIPKPARELYRDREDVRQEFKDPRNDGFQDWLRSHTNILNLPDRRA